MSLKFDHKIFDDLDKAEKKRLSTAARYVVKKVKENVRRTWKKQSGNLLKGVVNKPLQHAQLVGYGPPAYHAHMLELGTVKRTVKNYMGKKGVAVSVGHIKPKPVLFPTFEQEAGEVENILAKAWV